MRKRLIILILMLSLILCVLLGYCVGANLRAGKKEQIDLSTGKETGKLPLKAEVSTGVESEAKETESMMQTTQATVGTTYNTEPSHTKPPVTESSATNPLVTAPTAEESLATEPPTTERTEEPTLGENQLPGI